MEEGVEVLWHTISIDGRSEQELNELREKVCFARHFPPARSLYDIELPQTKSNSFTSS
jgi:hypothetical protein